MAVRQQIEEAIGPVSMATHFEHNMPYIAPLLLFIIFLYSINKQSKLSAPLINPKKRGEFTITGAANRFVANSREILAQGRSMYRHEPYRAYTDLGEVLVLPPEYINELKSHPDLDFLKAAAEVSGFVEIFEILQCKPSQETNGDTVGSTWLCTWI
jgi:hypothetical protein